MFNPAPTMDERTAAEIVQQVQELLTKHYAPQWKEFDPATGKPKGVSAALLGIFGRFTELIIQRLNQVPDKNFLAYLDLLGVSLLPPQPARVPLTFSLAAGSTADGVVPAGTQVAAEPAEGEKEPVIFETERELVVTAAQLASLFVRDPEQDQYADHSAIIAPASSSEVPAFQGDRRIEHILYLAHNRLFGFDQIENLFLHFTLAPNGLQDARELKWEIWDETQWLDKTPAANKDQTNNLTTSGVIDLGKLASPIPISTVDLKDYRWLRCRLVTPITRMQDTRTGMVRENQLPQVNQAKIEVHLLRPLSEGLLPQAAFANTLPVELGKDFFPFGEKPKLNDALYLANSEAFSKDRAQNLAAASAEVQLEIEVANSYLIPTATSIRPSDDLKLAWECWNGTTWEQVGMSTAPPWLSLLELDPVPPFTEDTFVRVQGTVPKGASVSTTGRKVTGEDIIVKVGEDGRFAVDVALTASFNSIRFTASTKKQSMTDWVVIFRGKPEEQTIQLKIEAPPSPVPFANNKITLRVSAEGSAASKVKAIRLTNGRADKPVPVMGSPGAPMTIPLEVGRNELLIEGLDATGTNASVIAATAAVISREADRTPPLNASGFSDGTQAFCQSGIVTLKLPDTVGKVVVNGQENYWLRVRILNGNYGKEAAYKLKDPTKPEDGFTLILATFRPPIISEAKIGYEQTLSAFPEIARAYNNLAHEDLTSANNAGNQPFMPFRAAPEERPTLYLGFTLPAGRTAFPNRTLSLFGRVAEAKYGEKTVPIWPARSERTGPAGSEVEHVFLITNAGAARETFNLAILGMKPEWKAILSAPQIDIDAGKSQEITIRVTIPTDVPVEGSDRGFLRLTTPSDSAHEHNAVFVTFAGAEAPSGERPQLIWEYWSGKDWIKLTVRDNSENFTRPGLIEFLGPKDFARRNEFGSERYWLRVRWEKGEYDIEPRLHRMLLNTTMAAQTITIRNEIIGASDGSENQKFKTTRAPVRFGQQLEVREPEMPSAAELAAIEKEEGEDAISHRNGTTGRPKEIWVRWHEVPDFYGSGPRDRHYVLDHLTGEIRFGNGLNGLIPPRGLGNLRIVRYQTEGGQAGNKPAGAITQLKTTVPYVDKVTNTEAASGGADAESLDSLRERGPRTIRHRGRSVTFEDYEDLATLASPEVARAKCVPLRNLVENPLDAMPAIPGTVSVIIVPRSTETKPLPSQELISRVQDYLEANSIPTTRLHVVGPLYVSVNVTAEIALVSLEGASAVEQAVQQKLISFLHPLTGGLDRTGWAFGREPHLSDLYALIEAIPGVDHVRTLKVNQQEDQEGVKATGRFLVYSGTHTISLVFEET
jgi:hypothetical protein